MRKRQQGYGIVIFLLITCMLMGVLAAAMSGGTSTASMFASNNTAQIVAAQASLIRARILQCATDYPEGNNGTAFRVGYPAAAIAANVSALTCPGSGLNLWAQSDGIAMPASVSGFDAWQYTNDATSMRLVVNTNTADRANLVAKIVSMLGAQASETTTSGTVHTLTWIMAQ